MPDTRSSGMHIRVNPEIKAKVEPMTENGYTPEFESALLSDADECYAAVANGTAKLYKNVSEASAILAGCA